MNNDSSSIRSLPGRQYDLDAIETDRLVKLKSRQHPGQQYKVAVIGEPAFLTQQGDQISTEPDVGIHWDLDCVRTANSHGSLPTP